MGMQSIGIPRICSQKVPQHHLEQVIQFLYRSQAYRVSSLQCRISLSYCDKVFCNKTEQASHKLHIQTHDKTTHMMTHTAYNYMYYNGSLSISKLGGCSGFSSRLLHKKQRLMLDRMQFLIRFQVIGYMTYFNPFPHKKINFLLTSA